MTLHEQKTALAEWAPDLLFIADGNVIHWLDDEGLDDVVSDREWLEVAWRLEERVGEVYWRHLLDIVEPRKQAISVDPWYCLRLAGHAAAPQRIEALCRTLWPERFT